MRKRIYTVSIREVGPPAEYIWRVTDSDYAEVAIGIGSSPGSAEAFARAAIREIRGGERPSPSREVDHFTVEFGGDAPPMVEESTKAEIKAALEGDSNDAEHDALVSVAADLGIEYTACDDVLND